MSLLLLFSFILFINIPFESNESNVLSNNELENEKTVDCTKQFPSESYRPNGNGYIVNWLIVGPFNCGTDWANSYTNAGNHINTSLTYIAGSYATPEDNPIGGSTGAMDVPSMFPSNYLETLTIMTWVKYDTLPDDMDVIMIPYVISETSTLLFLRTKSNIALLHDFYGDLYEESKYITVLPWTALLEKKIWVKYFEVNKEFTPKKEALSFTDVSNLVYCEEYQINNIATYDDHFNAFLKVYLPKI